MHAPTETVYALASRVFSISQDRLGQKWGTFLAKLGVSAMLCAAGYAHAAVAPSLGGAQSFAVLGGSTVTNTGSSIISGDIGVSPGSSVTGFPPGIVGAGSIHASDATANAAHNALVSINSDLTGQPCTTNLTGQDLGGLTLTPGVYCFNTSAQLTGSLTLDGQGDPNAVFIVKIGSTFTAASNSTVAMINSGQACNVFWQMGSSATLGSGTSFLGNALAAASITLNTGVTVSGRVLAGSGAVTLDTNPITVAACAAPVLPTITVSKVSNGGVGTFSFTGTNGFVNQSITTVTQGVGVAGATQTLTAAGVGTVLTEAVPPAGYALTAVSCSGLGTGGAATPNLGARTVTLDTLATAAGSAIACTFTNTFTPVAAIAAIPTLSEWALLFLATLLAVLGASLIPRADGSSRVRGAD